MGHPSVKACQEAIDSAEFAEWVAYDQLSPIGPERADALTAHQMALMANINRDPKKQKQPFTALDFIPQWDHGAGADADGEGEAEGAIVQARPRRRASGRMEQTPAEMRARWELIVAGQNAAARRRSSSG